MPLRLITGAANAGKTGEVLKRAVNAAAAGASPVIAVPGLADVRRIEIELSGKTPLGVRVVTLRQLALDLWSLHGDGRGVVGEATREAILTRILLGHISPAISDTAKTPGFAKLMMRLVAWSSAAAPEPGAPRAAGAALEALIQQYREGLGEAGLVESHWIGELLAVTPPDLGGPICVARFDSLAAHELRLLVGLARANDVDIALTWEHMFAPTIANEAAVAHLSDIAAEHLVLPEPAATGEIAILARALFSGPAAVSSCGAVTTGLASGGEAEAALIARWVAGEIAEGRPAERIVIALPRAARRADVLEKALLSRGVSADFDVSTPMLATGLGRAWHALLCLAAGRGGRPEALTYLASPYSGEARRSAHEHDRRWRRNRVTDPAALLDSLRAVGEGCERAAGMARRLSRKRLTPDVLPDWQELVDLMISSAWEGSQGREVGRVAAQDAAAYAAIGRTLAEMARDSEDAPDVSAVLAAVAGISVREKADESGGRVQVCDFRRVGSRRFDVVVLGGLTENEVSVSSRHDVEDELRSDDLRGVEGEPADLLRLEFYSLVSRARNRLYLVRQEADSEGRERRASALWDDVLDAYRPLGGSEDEPALAPPPCERIARADIEDLAPALTISRREQRKAASGLRLALPNREEISSAAGLSAVASRVVFSATEIETYLECPYKWFYERVVRPEEIDRVFEARELGTLAHGLLAAFYRRVSAETGHDRVTGDWLDEALALFGRVVADEWPGLGVADGLSEELAAARAVTWARNVVGQDASLLPGFVPEFVELEFGEAEPFGFAGHALRGRIDRVDTCPSSVFVTDYKSSPEVTGIAKFEAEAKVQAVIYACASESVLGRPVSGSVYRSLRSGRLRGFWRSDLLGERPPGMCEDDAIDAEGYAGLVGRTQERVDRAVSDMRAGRVPRTPAVKGACTYCQLSTACEGARS